MLLIRQCVIGGALVSVAHMPPLLLVPVDVVAVFLALIRVVLVMLFAVTKGLSELGNVGTSGVLILPRKIFPSTSLFASAPTAVSASLCV